MDKLLEIKIGGGSVRSGWVPLAAIEMVRDLLAAIAEEGPDEEIWKSIDPQLEVVGKASTLLAIHTNFAAKLRPQVRAFREKAKRHSLKPRGRQFVKKHIAAPGARWSYVTMVEVPEKKAKDQPVPDKDRVLKFDVRYREQLLLKQAEPIHGFDEIYAVVKRAGGDTPTATIELLNGGGGTYQIRGRDRRGLAKRIAAHLYDTVKLKVEAWWNANTLELDDLAIHDLLDWRDIHLAEVYREHGGRLPLTLAVESVEELVAAREEDRRE